MSPLIPIEQALETILSDVTPSARHMELSLQQCLGHVLAESLIADINVPPADNSAMDGYAMNAEDDLIQSGGTYRISDRIPAGTRGQSLEAGTLVRIFTGGEIPTGANAVVMQENTTLLGEDKVVLLDKPALGQNVRGQGQDIRKGSEILKEGKRITAPDLGLMASVGIHQVKVVRPLKVGILTTGNELVDPPTPLQPGQIYNSNRFSLEALVSGLGMEPHYYGSVEDTPEATRAALSSAAASCDCLISSGGVSVGEEDHVKAQVQALGQLNVWRIAIKPGKPLAFGSVEGTPFFGLPGNPVSSFVTFCLFARPFLLKLQGARDIQPPSYMAPVSFDYQGGSRVEFLRVRAFVQGGEMAIEPFEHQGSGVMSSLSWANALAKVGIDQQVRKGDRLRIYPLDLFFH